MTRSKKEFETVLSLIAEGRNDCEVARITGVPRSTVRDWRSGRFGDSRRPPTDGDAQDHRCQGGHDFSGLPTRAYTYLLGMYLGDGCISESRRGVTRLRIVCDARYPGIIRECCSAIEAVMPGQHAYCLSRPTRCIEISMSSKHWPCLFPQHGPGRKHNRSIQLEAWQEGFVTRAPESFTRGLIHSDGCRVIADDRGVVSVRYHFSNRSEDIKALFCWALDMLEIHWTRPDDRGIAIYRKADVAQLDTFIGPKT